MRDLSISLHFEGPLHQSVGFVAVFRQPHIHTRQSADKYCTNQSEWRQGRNE